jgi:hypothetical protein
MGEFEDMPVLEREELPFQWGGNQNEENIPPRGNKKKQFDFKLNRNLNPEELNGTGFRCLSAGQASSGRFKGNK